MNKDEKIRLVLETLGVDSVRQATKSLRELEKSLDDVGHAANSTAGGGSSARKSGGAYSKGGLPTGQGILQLAYFVDDMQYGIRGIMNNIPMVLQALGAGAGLAGVLSMVAVPLGIMIEMHPEWFKWSEKVRLSLNELVDSIKAEEEALKRQKEAVDKLGKSNSTRIEDLVKLQSMTEDLKAAEDALALARKNHKAAEDAASKTGTAAGDEFGFQKDVIKNLITDQGMQPELLKTIGKAVYDATPQVDEKSILKEAAKMAEQSLAGAGWEEMDEGMKADYIQEMTPQAKAKLSFERNKTVSDSTRSIFGGLISPKDQAELDEAMKQIGTLVPQVAASIHQFYDMEKRSEEVDAELTKSIEDIRESTDIRKKDKAEAQKHLDSGMAPGAQLRGLYEADEREKKFKGEAVEEAAKARNQAIRDQVTAKFDPTQLAARRVQMAGVGPGARRRLAMLENQDLSQMSQMMDEAGMKPGEARASARDELMSGKNQLLDIAKQTSENTGRTVSLMETSNLLINKLIQENLAIRQRQDTIEQNQTVNMQGMQAPARPQMFRANH